jgi:hypothetical protein
VLKALRIWDKALLEGHGDLGQEEKFPQVENQASSAKTGET